MIHYLEFLYPRQTEGAGFDPVNSPQSSIDIETNANTTMSTQVVSFIKRVSWLGANQGPFGFFVYFLSPMQRLRPSKYLLLLAPGLKPSASGSRPQHSLSVQTLSFFVVLACHLANTRWVQLTLSSLSPLF